MDIHLSTASLKSYLYTGMVVHTCNPSTQRGTHRRKEDEKLEAAYAL